MVGWEYPTNPREASGLDPEAVHLAKWVSDDAEIVRDRLARISRTAEAIIEAVQAVQLWHELTNVGMFSMGLLVNTSANPNDTLERWGVQHGWFISPGRGEGRLAACLMSQYATCRRVQATVRRIDSADDHDTCPEWEKRVVFAIDEAHNLVGDSASLEFLETAVRHSRHYDLSIQFISQTGGEFSLSPESRTIANLCSLVMLHRVDESAGDLAEWFGLSDREANWERTAKEGADEAGFSEALLGIDEGGWFRYGFGREQPSNQSSRVSRTK